MDVLQSWDMDNCKLPPVGGGSVHTCVCGDKAASIPDEQRADKSSSALWCHGPLLLNKWDGAERLVWNPFSFQELLDQASNGNVDQYLECLENARGGCVPPQSSKLQAQGVELLQVIARCRANYQQSQWDEGARLLGVLTVDEWQTLGGAKLDHGRVSHRQHRLKLQSLAVRTCTHLRALFKA